MAGRSRVPVMSAELVMAVVGAGNWGRNLIRNFAQSPRVRLKYICDSHRKTLDSQAARYPGTQGVTDFNDVLNDPEVTAIAIATSANTHFDLATRALERGRHVFVEKPLTLSTADADALVATAEKAGRILMVGHLLEHHPAVRCIADMIRADDFGDVYYMYTQRINLGVVRSNENAWWSLAPHDISVICRLYDAAPVEVAAQGQSYLQNGIEDVVFATLKFGDGKLGHIHVSWLDPHKVRKITIIGTRRMVTFDDMSTNEKVWVYDKGAEARGFTDVTLRVGDIVIPKIPGGEPLSIECRHFVDGVLDGTPILTDGHDGARVVRVLEAGQRSLECGGAPVEM
jgi:predicted dehydrogenase